MEDKKKDVTEEKEEVKMDDVIADDLKELETKLDDLSESQKEVGVLASGDKFKYVGPTAADGVMGFAKFLTTVKTFKAGTRGDADKLLKMAVDYCDAQGFGKTIE